ncbi:MAG: chloride channel protein [Ignavibacteriales bacterium]|nr:chloride channel protein [Ignavibacteriales bacterium]
MKPTRRHIKLYSRLLGKKILSYLKLRIEYKTFLIIASLCVGIFSGLAASILKNTVHFIQNETHTLFNNLGIQYLLPITPLIGILLSILIVKVMFDGKIVKGLSNIIYSIIRKKSDIPRRKILSHLLTSGITVGMGGSAGLEAPIVIIGASIGSNVAKELKLNYKTRTLLLACGSAAGISAIFNSPIAGVIFAFEVLLPEITVYSFIPLLIASASSAVLSKMLYSGQLFYLVTEGWHLYAIPFYILLGIICGFVSLYMIRTSHYIENVLNNYNKPIRKAIIGGLVLCTMILLLPPLFGEGYTTVINLLAGRQNELLDSSIYRIFNNKELALLVFIAIIILTKVVATALTIGSGGNGGIIAPSLFTGALTGFFLAQVVSYLGISELNRANFIVVGMAGILSGVIHAPLTGIFLIAEITGVYVLIVPLMIVVALSFFISKHFNQNSIYTTSLAEKGIQFRSKREYFFTQEIKLEDLIETDFITLNPNMTLRIIMEKLTHTRRNLFPVIDEKEQLVGIITLDEIREIILDKEAYDFILVGDIMSQYFDSIEINTEFIEVMEYFEEKNIWNLPVTDGGKYVGFLSKSNIFQRYSTLWTKQQNEGI